MSYPREVGSDTRVDEKDWKQDNPFGLCPACGSKAIEDIPILGDEIINFYCSDTTCRDLRGRRTMWGTPKSQELLEQEAEGKSWNELNWPEVELPFACPD